MTIDAPDSVKTTYCGRGSKTHLKCEGRRRDFGMQALTGVDDGRNQTNTVMTMPANVYDS